LTLFSPQVFVKTAKALSNSESQRGELGKEVAFSNQLPNSSPSNDSMVERAETIAFILSFTCRHYSNSLISASFGFKVPTSEMIALSVFQLLQNLCGA
jgi:hypothetical protein